jgi:hypothetical protein
MPFRNGGSHSFTAVSIRNNVPAVPGIYGLSNAQSWVFIGASNNLQLQLLNHLRETDSLLKAQNPTGYTFEVCDPSASAVRQSQLIFELRPITNGRP